MDIVIGNSDQNNQVLLNDGSGSYSQATDLPGGAMDTESIAAADINGDGMLDIVIGNYDQNNQVLLNDGSGSYSEAIDLPGGAMNVSHMIHCAAQSLKIDFSVRSHFNKYFEV